MSWTKRAAEIYRDYVSAPNPLSGAWWPPKADLRVWGREIEDKVDAADPSAIADSLAEAQASATAAREAADIARASLTNPSVVYDDYAAPGGLAGDLAHAANTMGQVLTGPEAGLYVKVGASGTGSWAKKSGATIPGLEARAKLTEQRLGVSAGLRLDVDPSADGYTLADADGAVGLHIDRSGTLKVAAVDAPIVYGEARIERAPDDSPVLWGLVDGDGAVGLGVLPDGKLYIHGLDRDSVGEGTGIVANVWPEPWGDPSRSLTVSWVEKDTSVVDVIEYRLAGSSSWQAARSQWTRPLPGVPGRTIHTALLADLSPASRYELRWPGAMLRETLVTCPRRGMRVMVGSDWHRMGSMVPITQSIITANGVDLVVLAGDQIDDDGGRSPAAAIDWTTLLGAWRNAAGDLLPVISLVGNHEGHDVYNTTNAIAGGDGVLGSFAQVPSWAMDPDQPTRVMDGVGTCSIGKELLIIGLNTSHTVPLTEQIPWLTEQLARAPSYRHVMVVGHVPAFLCNATYDFEEDDQSRVLRTQVWPLMCMHADKVRCYVAGHEHVLSVTARLRVDYDPGIPLAGNDRRWRTDPVGGVRQLGAGGMGGSRLPVSTARAGELSILDGSPKIIAAAGVSSGTLQLYGSGIHGIVGADTRHVWVLGFDRETWSADARGTDGASLYAISESI